ncbi:MAG: ASKHA domain-containing protein [Thermodesulfovibrionales bacterium]|nr:ASKHA domain-containing protein [Thermodesulfovibrionales bacterium]
MELRLTSDEVIKLHKGENIYSALKKAGIFIVAPCGGKGLCSKCKIKILKGEYKVRSYGKLNIHERESNLSLACQTYPQGDIVIEIPKESQLVIGDKIAIAKTKDLIELFKSFKVSITPLTKRVLLDLPKPSITDNLSDLERLKRAIKDLGIKNITFSYDFGISMSKTLRESEWIVLLTYVDRGNSSAEALFLSHPESCNRRFGIAVDIGTTTVVVYLVNLINGEIIDLGSTYNSQIRFGDDVITRIIHASEGGLEELQEAVISDINNIVNSMLQRHNIEACEIDSASIAGNTTMSHLFWGIDPSPIREDPYIPPLNYFPLWRAGTVKLSINPQAPVYTHPCIASYVGGDIVAGLLATKLHKNHEISLFMDIGTNGEIAIGNNEWIVTAACSAGPCFEGSGIKCGMRATPGAIESVKIDPITFEPFINVIGNITPQGICGSGMIDIMSEMFLTGLIDQKGKLISGKTNRVRKGEEGLEYLLYRSEDHHKDVVLTEVDIENLMRAKAAIYAGLTTLLNEIGLSIDVIKRVYIAGGFGAYINIPKAIMLGMLPDLPLDRFVYMGNTSLTGAYLCLLSEELRKEEEEIASKMTYIELSVSRKFMDEYVSAMFLPHTDISRFPTVASLLSEIMTPKKFWLFTNPEQDTS